MSEIEKIRVNQYGFYNKESLYKLNGRSIVILNVIALRAIAIYNKKVFELELKICHFKVIAIIKKT